MFTARRIPLEPKRVYEVHFHPKFVDELVDHPRGDEILQELDHYLSLDERHLRRGATKKITERAEVRLFRYRPSVDHSIRILYGVNNEERFVVMMIPRKSEYRKSDLDTATNRIHQERI